MRQFVITNFTGNLFTFRASFVIFLVCRPWWWSSGDAILSPTITSLSAVIYSSVFLMIPLFRCHQLWITWAVVFLSFAIKIASGFGAGCCLRGNSRLIGCKLGSVIAAPGVNFRGFSHELSSAAAAPGIGFLIVSSCCRGVGCVDFLIGLCFRRFGRELSSAGAAPGINFLIGCKLASAVAAPGIGS